MMGEGRIGSNGGQPLHQAHSDHETENLFLAGKKLEAEALEQIRGGTASSRLQGARLCAPTGRACVSIL